MALKSIITEIGNSWNVLKSEFELTKERIRELEERSTDIMQSEEQKEKRWGEINRNSETCGIPLSTQTYS